MAGDWIKNNVKYNTNNGNEMAETRKLKLH